MSRRWLAVFVALAVVSAPLLTGVGTAQTMGPPQVPDPMRAFSIVPPGQCGFINMTNQKCSHFQDQLEMYASLVDDDDVTEDELNRYFHSMQFGPGPNIERTYSPKEGVTVYRDREFGIPHIYADSLDNASFALGYVTAEDRMFQMDVFRHAARGTLTEFVGNDRNNNFLEMDIRTRREGYTEEEIQKMHDSLDERFGEMGRRVQSGLKAYADGVNKYITEMKADARKQPIEYGATANPPPAYPEPWTPNDTLFLVVLQLRVFGETAGFEMESAGLYAHLVKKHGRRRGRRMFRDFQFQNDPRSATTVPMGEGRFPTQRLGRVNRKSWAIPDNAAKIAEELQAANVARADTLRGLGLALAPSSNALLVAAKESATGNPLQIGAPQVGYGVPAFFLDVDVHAPGVDFRGPAVPGASALIPLGRGADYAWSLTTGFSDAVDTRIEKLCEPKGGKPDINSEGYLFKGRCRTMHEREETFFVKPTPANPGTPRTERRTFHRTIHGPVFLRGSVNGRPVAFVKQRFFWKKEIDSIPQFAKWNLEVDSLDDFRQAARNFTMSFNSFYADANNIAYFHVGHYPRRRRGMHPSLPTWGTGRWEWRGRLPFWRHPKMVNPAQGWVSNWNNKPSVGWKNFDTNKWGAIQRVQLLHNKMRGLLGGTGKAQLSDIVDVIRESATQDTRGVYLGPRMLAWAEASNPPPGSQRDLALNIVREWVQAGSHRRNRDRDANMDDGPALVIFDRWYDVLVHKIFDDELGKEGYDLVGPISDYRPAGGSSWWFDFSSYVKNLFNYRTARRYARNYCDNMKTKRRETCRRLVATSLRTALTQLNDERGSDMTKWTTPREDITFQSFGAGSVPPIPWQNRGTHNHVVEILSSAGSGSGGGGGSPTPVASPSG